MILCRKGGIEEEIKIEAVLLWEKTALSMRIEEGSIPFSLAKFMPGLLMLWLEDAVS